MTARAQIGAEGEVTLHNLHGGNVPSVLTIILLLSMGECVLEAGRDMWGEFL